uniref:peptide ABC transporter substrate-binding protein n=1 Tax=Nosocomiicoccus ampullae TaxID=489910 RepID=UPI00082D056B|nr:peptide ABC transporter substrate-binding protein [Nosocomiicoccus ampullae]
MNKLRTLMLLLGLVLVLAACDFGGGGSDSSSNEDGEALKELNVSINQDPPAFHPALATDTTSGVIVASVFEGLTRLDSDGTPVEGMAEKIDVSEDGKTYTYTLRDGKWANGDPVTAHDFEFAWKWALNPENAADYAYQLYYIQGAEEYNTGEGSADDVKVTALDDKTLEVELVNPTPFFDELTAFYTYYPVNSKVAEEDPDAYKNPNNENYIGNGPFNLDKFASSSEIVLKKNDEYWDKDNVDVDVVNVRIIESEATALKEFEAGNLDYLGAPFNSVDLNALDRFKESGDLSVSDMAGTYMITFNTEDDILKNKNIREALTTAIDRQGLIDNVTKGEQEPASGLVPLTMKGFEDHRDYFKSNDAEAAKEALEKGLEELGLNSPSEVKITLSYNTSEAHAAIMQFVQQNWIDTLGIDVTLDNSEWQVYLEELKSLDYQAGRYGWVGDFNDPYNFLELYKRKGGNNTTGWESKEYQDILDKATVETDEATRTQLLKDAEELFMKDFPVSPIYFYTNIAVKSDRVSNMDPDPLSNLQLKYVKVNE